jgi:hypothetical protein
LVDNTNHKELAEVLNSLINCVEKNYIDRGEISLVGYFDTEGFIEKGLIRREFAWSEIVRIVLVNLESVCRHLKRVPIPELLEDVAALQSLEEINRKKRRELESQRLKQVRDDHEKKNRFLVRLVNELEGNGTDRQQIKEIVMHDFKVEFTNMIKSMVRVNGEWRIAFFTIDVDNPIEEICVRPSPKLDAQ